MVRRDGLEIQLEILECCMTSTLPTRLMYKTNTSWNPMKKQVKLLIERKLLEVVTLGTKEYYKTTSKGWDVLNAFKKLQEKATSEKEH